MKIQKFPQGLTFKSKCNPLISSVLFQVSWNIAIFCLLMEILVTVSFLLLLTLKSFRKPKKAVFFRGRGAENLFCGVYGRWSHWWWLEARKLECQSTGWGRVGVRSARLSLEVSLQQRMLQLTTVFYSLYGDHFSPTQSPRSETL